MGVQYHTGYREHGCTHTAVAGTRKIVSLYLQRIYRVRHVPAAVPGLTGWWPSSCGKDWTGRWCACPSGPSDFGVRSRWNSRWPAVHRWPSSPGGWPTGSAPEAASA